MQRPRLVMLRHVTAAAQAATILLTWPLWQLRTSPPHLPWLDLPQLPFGPLLLGSLALTLWRPLAGAALHSLLLILAIACDQLREQPQVLSLALLPPLLEHPDFQAFAAIAKVLAQALCPAARGHFAWDKLFAAADRAAVRQALADRAALLSWVTAMGDHADAEVRNATRALLPLVQTAEAGAGGLKPANR